MLLVNEHKVKLPKSYFKILYLYPAYNDTYVFLGMISLKKDCVVHVDKEGNIAMPFNTQGMYRGYIKSNGETEIKMYKE